MAEQYGDSSLAASKAELLDVAYRGDLSELILASLKWIARRQNDDGGFGALPGGPSDLTTSLLVLSAFRLTCVPAKYADQEPRLEQYVRQQGGALALRRAAPDRPLPSRCTCCGVLCNAALAGVVSWRQTPLVRFERAASPAWLRKLLSNPQFNPNDPVVLATGLARFHRVKPRNPLLRWVRSASVEHCLGLIRQQQSPNGGFDDSVLTTSYVVMLLASTGRGSHPIVRRGVEFLLTNVHSDASWAPHVDEA